MGEEIEADGFTQADRDQFSRRLEAETALLRDVGRQGRFSSRGPCVGLELELWLIDRHYFPAPDNQRFLARLGDPDVVAELSRFNVEINAPVQEIAGQGLERMHAHLSESLRRCAANANADVNTVIAIGTLPSLRQEDVGLDTMTPANRFAALNRETMRLRGGKPIAIDIEARMPGEPRFTASYTDVMLESAATSLQLHLQLPPERIARAYDASVMLCAPLIALAANSPFLFGQPLWHETRIPVFEQSLAQREGKPRVTLGSGYARDDLISLFEENLNDYRPLLPVCEDAPIERFRCLHMHNGTVWRWVRPLLGFDPDGTPHLRIEQRVLPAGPSVIDMMANAALYFGAVHELAQGLDDAEALLPFATARENFYVAARHGLDAQIVWTGSARVRSVRDVLAELIGLAERGLRAQNMAEHLIGKYRATLDRRLETGRTGAAWQLAHYERHQDANLLTATYLDYQRTGLPVHEWLL